MEFKSYTETTYAAWLGKAIGIRLGAPVEGWTSQEIADTYGEIKGYPVDYGIFAADDDSNGPLFFVRALCQSTHPTIEQMGDTLLNYLCNGHGFFWWGGEGVSTEHTAYNNLKSGIRAPLSGSVAQNGQAIAEQIGGQIFSDCWGYVAGGNPALAKELASKMSCVTHDADGVEGGVFVAVCIALAYTMKDARAIVDEALTYIREDSDYHHVCCDIIRFYDDSPQDWKRCLTYIQEQYGYDKYPGICHILPNTAIMILALLYGDNDFYQTLTMLCMCGWDTDCTCGNVGSIMGAMTGLKKLPQDLVKPINDLMLASSVLGSENISTLSENALLYAALAFQLAGKEIPQPYADILSYQGIYNHFLLPGATHAFCTDSSRYKETSVRQCADGLRLIISNAYADETMHCFQKSYFIPSEVYDCRYEPSFTPRVFPGECLHMTVSNPLALPLRAALYALGRSGTYYVQDMTVLHNQTKLSYRIPPDLDDVIMEYGLRVYIQERIMRSYIIIHEQRVERTPQYRINYQKEVLEDWGKTFGDTRFTAISQHTLHSGVAALVDGSLYLSGKEGMIITADAKAQLSSITVRSTYSGTGTLSILFNVRGYMYYQGIAVNNTGLKVIEKKDGIHILAENTVNVVPNEIFTLKIDRKCGLIKVQYNDKEILQAHDKSFDNQWGAVAVLVEGSSCFIHDWKMAY